MDIIVLAKYVPNIDSIPDDAWDREKGTLIRSRLQMVFNPFDRAALNIAKNIKKEFRNNEKNCRIIAISMGAPNTEEMLREMIAYGSDKAVLLTDRAFAGADTIATAYTISESIKNLIKQNYINENFCIIAGMQSPDGDTAQVPAQVASLLDIPLHPYISDLDFPNGDLEFTCLHPLGVQKITPKSFPFVATATRIFPDLSFHLDIDAIYKANLATIDTYASEDFDFDLNRLGLRGSKTRVAKIFEQNLKAKKQEIIEINEKDFETKILKMTKNLSQALGANEDKQNSSEFSKETNEEKESYYNGDCVSLCEVINGKIHRSSLEITSECTKIARELKVGSIAIVPGAQDQNIAEELKKYGAEKIYFIPSLEKEIHLHNKANIIFTLLREIKPQIVLVASTLEGRVIAPYIAAKLNCGLTADCAFLEIQDWEMQNKKYQNILHQTRPALGGNIMATIISIYEDNTNHPPQMATVRPGTLEAKTYHQSCSEIIVFDTEGEAPRCEDKISFCTKEEKKEKINLEEYDIIVCVGMGVANEKNIEKSIKPFCIKLEKLFNTKISLACTRGLVDNNVLGHEYQIGQTGMIVKPKIYFGIGVSGAIQHRVGMEKSDIIVSINSDPDAQINVFADYVILGDFEEILEKLREII